MAVWLAENDLWLAVENDLVNARAEVSLGGERLAWFDFPRYRTKSARSA
jgi:hypothetical protein